MESLKTRAVTETTHLKTDMTIFKEVVESMEREISVMSDLQKELFTMSREILISSSPYYCSE